MAIEMAQGSCFWRHAWTKWQQCESIDMDGRQQAVQARHCVRCGRMDVLALRARSA